MNKHLQRNKAKNKQTKKKQNKKNKTKTKQTLTAFFYPHQSNPPLPYMPFVQPKREKQI